MLINDCLTTNDEMPDYTHYKKIGTYTDSVLATNLNGSKRERCSSALILLRLEEPLHRPDSQRSQTSSDTCISVFFIKVV